MCIRDRNGAMYKASTTDGLNMNHVEYSDDKGVIAVSGGTFDQAVPKELSLIHIWQYSAIPKLNHWTFWDILRCSKYAGATTIDIPKSAFSINAAPIARKKSPKA